MSYIANTAADRALMCAALGISSPEALFDEIPEAFRFPSLRLPFPLSEPELLRELEELSNRNAVAGWTSFAGGGAYNHFIPSVVDALTSRGEFLTSYTPYQPEVSQGTLQVLFEYQTMMAGLLGMDVVNASHYDGATALAEAVLMATRGGRRKVVVSEGVHPDYRAVLRAYSAESVELVVTEEVDAGGLAAAIDQESASVVVGFPTFFGELRDYRKLAETVHAKGALLIVVVDPVCLGLFAPPGSYGADIVVAEGQGLGNHRSFGGPYLGILATTNVLVRRMPGRLAGQTSDADGRCGYVLTLCTREQHIRREKATSNICTNQALLACRTAIHLAALGPSGLREVGELCFHRAAYAADRLASIRGCSVVSTRPFFKEFVLRTPVAAETLCAELAPRKLVPGLPLARWFPRRANDLLVCVTEMTSKADIDALAGAVGEVIDGT